MYANASKATLPSGERASENYLNKARRTNALKRANKEAECGRQVERKPGAARKTRSKGDIGEIRLLARGGATSAGARIAGAAAMVGFATGNARRVLQEGL